MQIGLSTHDQRTLGRGLTRKFVQFQLAQTERAPAVFANRLNINFNYATKGCGRESSAGVALLGLVE